MRTVENFKNWAYKKDKEFKEFKKTRDYLQFCYYENNVLLLDRRNGRVWKAVCHKDDTFDVRIGRGVAFAKYQGEEIPAEISKIKISELNYGDKFKFCANSNETLIYTYIAKHPLKNRCVISAENGVIYVTDCYDDVYKI